MSKLLLIFLLVIAGCSSTSTTLPTPNWVPWELTNRASIPFEHEGKKFNGAGVLPRKPSQKITFTLPKDTVKLMINSCNREEFFGYPQSPFNWIYTPIPSIENVDSCLVMATAITKQGELYKAVVDFRGEESVKATVKCNGVSEEATGVALCQTRAGLLEGIQFYEEVVWTTLSGCSPLEESLFNFSYTFKVIPGYCTYRFLTKDKGQFRLTTYGYQSIDEIKVESKTSTNTSTTSPGGFGDK